MLSVSATTRAPRPGEVDGLDYYFLSHAEFARRRNAGEFLECKEVFGRGDWYGTLRQVVDRGLESGKWVILEIDVQGALCVMEQCDNTISLFVHPGSPAELERRLRTRGTETEASIQRRLQVAADEMKSAHRYDYIVVNEEVSRTVQEICQLLKQCTSRRRRIMLEDLKEEAIVNKVGGRFKLSTLIQKRLVQLNRGSRPLVDNPPESKMEIVLQEILQDKIYLTQSGNAAIVGEPEGGELLDMDSFDM